MICQSSLLEAETMARAIDAVTKAEAAALFAFHARTSAEYEAALTIAAAMSTKSSDKLAAERAITAYVLAAAQETAAVEAHASARATLEAFSAQRASAQLNAHPSNSVVDCAAPAGKSVDDAFSSLVQLSKANMTEFETQMTLRVAKNVNSRTKTSSSNISEPETVHSNSEQTNQDKSQVSSATPANAKYFGSLLARKKLIKEASAESSAVEKLEQLNSVMTTPEKNPYNVEAKPIPWTLDALESFGVPHLNCEQVLVLAGLLGVNQGEMEPLCDPFTLLRFLNARNGVPVDAAHMYRTTLQWRDEFGLPRIMAEFGCGAAYDARPSTGAALVGSGWRFVRGPTTEAARTIERISFFQNLDACDPDGAAVVLWRIGMLDFTGIAREKIVPEMARCMVSHFEEMLQMGRRLSFQKGTLARVKIIIDGTGLTFGTLAHLGLLKSIASAGKAYFPEIAASATIINAPWIMSSLWNVISPQLSPLQQSKVCILDSAFAPGLKSHAGISIDVLPACLGGKVPDLECPAPITVPVGLGQRLRQPKGS